ncbi:uncharacterized protein LOC135489107 [Lineus longissimus]|uniref:uncharacterized protein LOC135489107 n=1 Tax=Lineus longissimus TaxID=88925 RepID=UPI00315DD7F4
MILREILIAAVFCQGIAAVIISGQRRDPIAFFGYDWWIILGQTEDSNTLNGLTVHFNDVETSDDGPKDMTAWEFKGTQNSYVRVENPSNGPLEFDKSFTIGTYFYQDYIKNVPIVEWRGRSGDPFGTHFWIWEQLLFINLGPTWGDAFGQNWHSEVSPGGWHFIGASYNHLEGNLTMWIDTIDYAHVTHIGLQTSTCIGDVYVGKSPHKKSVNQTKTKLAGLTIIDGAIDKEQIKEFKCNIVAFVANESPEVSFLDWIPHTDNFFTSCYFEPDDIPLKLQGLPAANPKTYACSSKATNPHQFFATSWWNVLGQDENNPNLNGLQLEVEGVDTTMDGPNGIPCWNFLGSPNSYIRIPNPIGGHLDMRDSFTIGTFIYQSELRNGAIWEWRGKERSRQGFATHFWIWGHALFVNLVGIGQHRFNAVQINSWHFIGMSFSRERSHFIMWIDDASNSYGQYVSGSASAFGDVYIGNRGSNHNFVPFKGKLAGMTVLNGDIELDQIDDFKCKILLNVALGIPAPSRTPAVPQSRLLGNDWWIILGQDEQSQTLNGLQLQVHGVTTTGSGPFGLTPWEFKGTIQSYIKINNPHNGHLNFDMSFTVGTFIYQNETKNGPILEWRGKRNGWGTHLWIWHRTLFLNLAPRFGGRSEHFHTAVEPRKWSFVGATFDHDTGSLTMWVNGNVFQQNVGRRTPDSRGNIYIGNRGSARWFEPFKGSLAGLTVLNGAINASEIKLFKCLIVALASKGSYPIAWDPAADKSFERCQLEPDPTVSTQQANHKTYTCNGFQSLSTYFGFNWWNILGQNKINTHLNGLSLDVVGVDTSRDGPNGIAAWNFKGNSRSYVRVTNRGHLDLVDFTIGTFIYQHQITNGAILEWRGPDNARYGAHFWIWFHVPFVNLGATSSHFREAVPTDSWHFIGASYSHRSGRQLMWKDNTTNVRDFGPGRRAKCSGDVFIGNRGSDHSFSPFKGKLAGLTILDGAISESEIEEFKCKILATVST